MCRVNSLVAVGMVATAGGRPVANISISNVHRKPLRMAVRKLSNYTARVAFLAVEECGRNRCVNPASADHIPAPLRAADVLPLAPVLRALCVDECEVVYVVVLQFSGHVRNVGHRAVISGVHKNDGAGDARNFRHVDHATVAAVAGERVCRAEPAVVVAVAVLSAINPHRRSLLRCCWQSRRKVHRLRLCVSKLRAQMDT